MDRRTTTARTAWYSRGPVQLALAGAVALIGLFALHALAHEVTFAQLRAALRATAGADVAAAIALTALSFFALGFYDVLATRTAVPGRVPARVAWLAGATGYAVSNMLGFALLTGGALRARLYGARGLAPGEVAEVIAAAWLTFYMGMSIALGTVLLLDPAGPAARLGLPPVVDRAVGAVLLGCVAAFLIWIGRGATGVTIRGRRVALPPLRIALMQAAFSLLDVAAAALALWVLLPASAEIGPATFFVAYMAAILVGLVSHSPGGLGAFEAVLIAALGLAGRADVVASLILYRLIYYVLPFAAAAVGIAGVWWSGNRDGARRRAVALADAIAPLVPPLAGGVALLAGVILLFSGALPTLQPRTVALQEVAPLALVEASHLVGSAVGVALIVLARGLLARRNAAYRLAMMALALGAAASLLKGLDWEEASLLVAGMAVLALFRSAFYRGGRAVRLSWGWLLGAALLIGASVWLGLLAFRQVPYADELWWRFAWNGDASRFLRASVAASVALIALGTASLMRRPAPQEPAGPVPDAVRRIVAACPDSEASIALLGDKRFLTSPAGDAFLMFRRTGVALIAKADPMVLPGAAPGAGQALAWAFLEEADRAGLIPAFYAVGTEHLPTWLDMGLNVLKIGEVARVDLAAFTLEGKARKDLRYGYTRSAREGIAFAVVPPAEVPEMMAEMREVSDGWLDLKAGSEKSFALGAFDPDYLSNFPVATLRDADGTLIAFANVWPGDGRHEIAVDLMRHRPDAVAVVMDALFAHLLVWAKARGYAWFNLGAAPLAGLADHRLASRWNRIGAYLYQHGDVIYRFGGLRAFKQKFDPVWSPNYLVCPQGLPAARVLIEVNRLISGGARGLLR